MQNDYALKTEPNPYLQIRTPAASPSSQTSFFKKEPVLSTLARCWARAIFSPLGATPSLLVKQFGNLTSTYGTATLANRKPQTHIQCHRVDQLHGDLYIIARHRHFYTFRQRYLSGYV